MPSTGPERRASTLAAEGRNATKLLALFAVLFLAVRFCVSLPHGVLRIAPVWLSSAIMLTVLLRSPGRRWPLLIAVGLAAHLLAGFSVGFSPARLIVRGLAALLEYGGTAWLVRRLLGKGETLDLELPRHFIVLCGCAVGFALLAGALQSVALAFVSHEAVGDNMRAWGLSHPMCLMVLTPCLLVLSESRTHVTGRKLPLRAVWALTGLFAVILLVFGQSRLPLLFLSLPALVWVSLEAGLYGAAVAVLLTASVALPATIAGSGPVAISQGDVAERAAVLQLYLAVSLISTLPIAALQARWRRAEAQAREEARRARYAEAAAAASEAHHRSLTEQAPDAIGTMDLTGVLTFVSPVVAVITGYSAAELTGRDLKRMVHPDDLERLQANFRRLLRSGEGETIEYRLRRKDGEWVWLQANPRIVRDDAGEPVGTVDVVRDVTARKAMELELEAALEAARSAARVKADFLANMSHELRTPLTGILGYAEVLGRDPALPPASRCHAERIGAAGGMLLALVNDVLDLSRAAAGGLALHPSPMELVEVMQTSVDMIRPQAQKASLALSIEHVGRAPRVLADAGRLQQVLVNLLGNAVKFTARGVVTVSLRWEAVGDDKLDVRLSVADTGIGIAADRLPHIFDRFEQADGSIARSFGGAGLGLAISRTLVRAMGGEITVESTPGAGSVFTARLRLPRAESAGSAHAPTASVADEAPSLEGLRVLLAEDVAVNRDLIGLMLAPTGVRLHAVADGAEAVEAAAAQAFDVVLMDMQMPVMDGLEAARRIRAGGGPSAGARIVALTAAVLPEEIERCFVAGMDGHLGKPLTAAALQAELRVVRSGAPRLAAAA